MTKLSPCVYFYRPETPPSGCPTPETTQPPSIPPPKLIVLATWMGARDPHIAKYLLKYRELYPTSPILLLRSEQRHFILPGALARDLAPALPCVRSIFPNLGVGPDPGQQQLGRKKEPQLLLHAWSNGGASSLVHLREALRLSPEEQKEGREEQTSSSSPSAHLPPYTLVLDSTPGTYRYWAGYRAFTTGLSGWALWLAAPVVHALCMLSWLRHVVLGRRRTGPLARLRRALNDSHSRTAELRRTYVYGPGDALVGWRDVEAHAHDARRAGFVVRTETFQNSQHVAHARTDPDRYWRAVRETWEGSVE